MTHNTTDYEDMMRAAGHRVTPQRILILDAVSEGGGHTTLGEVYARVRRVDSSVDRSTLYRTLKLFVDLGFVVSANTGDGETYYYLGRAYNLTNKTAEATRYYGLAVKGLVDYAQNNPTYSDGWYLLGNAYFADNQREKAIGAYQKCLNLSPKFAKARLNLGIAYTRTKNKAGAVEQYSNLVKLDAKLAEILKAEIDNM